MWQEIMLFHTDPLNLFFFFLWLQGYSENSKYKLESDDMKFSSTKHFLKLRVTLIHVLVANIINEYLFFSSQISIEFISDNIRTT